MQRGSTGRPAAEQINGAHKGSPCIRASLECVGEEDRCCRDPRRGDNNSLSFLSLRTPCLQVSTE